MKVLVHALPKGHHQGRLKGRILLREKFLDGLTYGVPEIDPASGEVISRSEPRASWLAEAHRFLNSEDKKREAEEAEAKEKARQSNALEEAIGELPEFAEDEGNAPKARFSLASLAV
ncbi:MULTISPECIES: hypothetical protein [unclassified Ruegeria]|uniref:hypothetical protein n=1 Tax=unclassified Ruegeria TaxID=2625375 RepID=UPI0014890BF2|nr:MULTISPECIES: hypothetical protein [unclassified Ruegeria]NOD75085.1 hypothetical protein [Ruegeria sp. HKCCD4332]NOD87046.1 hypothetical protein [Ruegeria sp. HKCCD4318]NOE12601.1 hypothetical protein [Ruegeria sp. HKCCD4318-2]NOG09234.1 hypothetical protein [Ruegeria sp. HKCCD4315]